jgi:hypothetical protein
MLFDIPFIADWQKIGEHRQQLTDLNNAHENESRIDYDYKVGQKVLLRKEGILRNAESRWHKKPWLITSVHTNGTITVQCGNKIDRMNIRRVTCLKKIQITSKHLTVQVNTTFLCSHKLLCLGC